MEFQLPYGLRKIYVEIPDGNLMGVIEPKDLPPLPDVESKIKDALRNPIESPPLSMLARRASTVAIIATDISRPCPDHILLPPVIEELNKAGLRDDQIKVVIATGMHRPMTKEELKNKLGKEIFERVETINHVSTAEEDLRFIGNTPNLNIPLWINKEIVNADLVISTGMVDPHIFAGYTGGGKSILPGVSGQKTIEEMHKPERLDLPGVGVCSYDNNPIRMDMDEAGKMAGLKFIVNVVLNLKYEIAAVSAGNIIAAHRKLVKVVDKIVKVQLSEQPDIVISAPGYPKDRDLYQATRAANNFVCGPKPVIKKGGVIIIPAPCQDGVGSETFYNWMKEAKTLDEIFERGKREPIVGAHRPYIMAKILKHADVIIVGSKIPDKVEEMKMIAAQDMDEALEIAFNKVGKKAKVLITTHGLTVVPVV